MLQFSIIFNITKLHFYKVRNLMTLISIKASNKEFIIINNEFKIIIVQEIVRRMQNQNTHRSHNNSTRYITPRKTTVKKNKALINANINININNLTNSKSQSKEKDVSCEQFYDCGDSVKELKINDFQIIQQMGRGKFGYVYAALQKKSGYVVAIKKMSKLQLRENDFQEQVKREIIIQASLHHKNVLRLFGYFWDTQSVYLILQYAPEGQIFNILQKNKRLSEEQVSVVIRQVCSGLMYLHANNIIHRDIKPENILISGENVKIGDFGWSIQTYTRRETLCGTLDYLAPQIVKGQTHNHSIDLWQVGVLAYQLSVGRPPFQTGSTEQTHERIIKDQVQFPSYISFELRQFIRKILQKNPNKRIQCSQILKQPFILKYSHCQLNLNDMN